MPTSRRAAHRSPGPHRTAPGAAARSGPLRLQLALRDRMRDPGRGLVAVRPRSGHRGPRPEGALPVDARPALPGRLLVPRLGAEPSSPDPGRRGVRQHRVVSPRPRPPGGAAQRVAAGESRPPAAGGAAGVGRAGGPSRHAGRCWSGQHRPGAALLEESRISCSPVSCRTTTPTARRRADVDGRAARLRRVVEEAPELTALGENPSACRRPVAGAATYSGPHHGRCPPAARRRCLAVVPSHPRAQGPEHDRSFPSSRTPTRIRPWNSARPVSTRCPRTTASASGGAPPPSWASDNVTASAAPRRAARRAPARPGLRSDTARPRADPSHDPADR